MGIKLVYNNFFRLQHSKQEPVFSVELVEDNLFEWYVKIYKLDGESDLMQDMVELGIRYILLHLIFPDNFPFAPPFMRLISPRIEKGFVMEGKRLYPMINSKNLINIITRRSDMHGTSNTSRMGFGVHRRSGDNAVRSQCSERPRQSAT